jgi:hypothetical protein
MLKRLDHYVTLFFIPLFRVKRGERFLECERCGGLFDETGRQPSRGFEYTPYQICPKCDRRLDPEFKFCPYCGENMG